MNLKMQIHNIKCINDLTIELPLKSGLYAITGRNGSGKSTVVTCAARSFYDMQMHEYFGSTVNDAFIAFSYGSEFKRWYQYQGAWKCNRSRNFRVNGFYEGSLIYGNRFRLTSYKQIKKLDSIDKTKFKNADEFIKKNLGLVLQGDEEFYQNLIVLPEYSDFFDSDLFFYKVGEKLVSQFHMSTGENLLISLLSSLNKLIKKERKTVNPALVFIDEIEMALHPSSIKRLVDLLANLSIKYNYAIYFSTHSLELISGINPANIFYIERYPDNTFEIINPCYPAYATRILYDHSGYDNVILVEDDLAKRIIEKILHTKHLLNSRLVHVLPCGGYKNVITLANDVVANNLLNKTASVSIILDADIKEEVEICLEKKKIKNNVSLNYLPIPSLEKYLKDKLVLNVDHRLFRELNDYIFLQKSLTDIVSEYQKTDSSSDKNGKKFYSLLIDELEERKKNRDDLIDIIVEYLFKINTPELQKTIDFLTKQFDGLD